MKISTRTAAVVLLAGLGIFHTPLRAEEPPVPMDKVLDQAFEIEDESSKTFAEIRALESAILMRVPVEEAMRNIEIAKPNRTRIDTSQLAQSARTSGQADEQKALMKATAAELENVLQNMEEMLAEFQQEEQREDAGVDVQAMLDEAQNSQELEDLAKEDTEHKAVDLTEKMNPEELRELTEAEKLEREAERMLDELKETEAELREEMESVTDSTTDSTEATTDSMEATTDSTEATTDSTEATTDSMEATTDSTTAKMSAVTAATAMAEEAKEAAQDAQDESATEEAKSGSTGTARKLLDDATKLLKEALGEEGKDSSSSSSSQGGRYNSPPASVRGNPIYEVPALPGRRIEAEGQQAGWVYLDSWYIIGPFPNPARRNIDKRFPPESIIDLDASYPGRNGEMVSWKFLQTDKPWVIPPWSHSEMIYYAYTEVWSDRPRDLWVALGSDDNSRVWLNGQLIWKSNYHLKPWRPDEGYRKVSLRQGINRVLYRVENGSYITRFSFLICTNPGAQPILPMKSLRRSKTDKAKTMIHR